jgi:proteasome lid subunit RPN8/RPN11
VRLLLDARLLDEMTGHFRNCLPDEGCGFLIGRKNVATRFVPAPNALRSQVAYEVEPSFLFDLLRALRASGEDLVAVCHSHPEGPAHPSRADLASAHYPDSFYVIVSLRGAEPDVRVWRILNGEAFEAELHANI